MLIIPAIDIYQGKCVRLFQGDFKKKTIFSTEPEKIAKQWMEAKVKRIHIVDLDGAKQGSLINSTTISKIISSVSCTIQLGGGIRTIPLAQQAFDLGAEKIIIGSAIIENINFLKQLTTHFNPKNIITSIDTIGDNIAIHGWTTKLPIKIDTLLKKIEAFGISEFVYTDVLKDGTLSSPNFNQIEMINNNTAMKMIVAGGISNTAHLKHIKNIGIHGCIIGKALYTGAIILSEAISLMDNNTLNYKGDVPTNGD